MSDSLPPASFPPPPSGYGPPVYAQSGYPQSGYPQSEYAQSGSAVPLDQPLYGATFGQAVGRYFRKYADFSGRASASEYWWSVLMNALAVGVLYVLLIAGAVASPTDPRTGEPEFTPLLGIVMGLYVVYALGQVLPTLAVIVRRLHDTGRSGWWYLISLIPFGSIALLVFLCQTSTPQGFAFDRRNGTPSLVVNPLLRHQQPGFGQPYGPPHGSPFAQPYGPPTDAPTWPYDGPR